MNVDQIIAAVARLHQKTAASLTSDERAVILQGLNDARVFAEREHDFKAAMDYGFALVDPVDGANFSTLPPSTYNDGVSRQAAPWDAETDYVPASAGTPLVYDSVNARLWACNSASGPSGELVDPSTFTEWAIGLSIGVDDIYLNDSGIYKAHTAHTSASLNEPGTGADWSDFWLPYVYWTPIETVSFMRDVVSAEVWDDVNEVWVRMDVIDEQTYRARWDGQYSQDAARSFEQPTLVLQGNSFMRIYGVDEEHDPYLVRLYGPFWLAPYVDVEGACTQTDFLTDHGHDFLMWSAALDANYRWMTWIPRQEGSMPPPENRRERAWAALLDWDNFVHLPRQQNYVR